MRKIRVSIALAIVISLLSVGTVFAYNITNATYAGTLSITNNGSSAAYNQTANFTLNTTALINAGFLNASLNNSALVYNGQDVPYMPGASGNQSWFAFIGNISALTNLSYTLYMGGNQTMNSTLVYIPGAAGMTATDNASLELGNNFTISQTGFIDTIAGANKWLVNKTGAFTTNITGNGNITSTATVNLSSTNITALEVTWVSYTAGAQNFISAPAVWLGGANTTGTSVNTSGATWQTFSQNLTRPGGGSWTFTDLSTLQIGVGANATGAFQTWTSQIFATAYYTTLMGVNTTVIMRPSANGTVMQGVNGVVGNTSAWMAVADIVSDNATSYIRRDTANSLMWFAQFNTTASSGITNNITLVATNVPTGNHTITTRTDSSNISIYVDSVLKDTVSMNGSSVVNNANNWTFCTYNATPYLSSQNISVNGTLRQYIAWQYKTTWPVLFGDTSGYGNTATPSFPTGGSSGNITANITGLTPITQTTSDPTSTAVTASNITATFVQPPGLYTELSISAPGANLTNSILDGAGIPRAIFWFPFLFGLLGLFGFATYWLTRSLLIQGIVMGFVIILFSLMGGFGYWVCIEFIIMAMAIIVGSKQYGF